MKNKLGDTGKILEADVLVLGSGAAGCGAALAAKSLGATVLLVDKAKLEGSGSIGGGNDHFMANLNSGPDWDTDKAVAEHVAGAKDGTGAETIEANWVKRMPVVIKMLEDAGLEFVKNPDGSYLRTVGFAQPGKWWINIKNGQMIKRLLAKKLRASQIDILDHVMIVRLLVGKDRIAGALGFNVLDGTFYILKGKTVVIALGREANRASLNSSLNPFNTMCYPFNTGSNQVLAYEAGAKIRNLELNDMATLIPKGFGSSGMNGLNSMGGHELNAMGERFMGKYDPVFWENTVRARQVVGTFQELIAGKGPPFYMDMRHLSKEDIELLQNVLMPGDKATFLDYLEQKGISFATHPMEIEISELQYGGRIVIDIRSESTLSGLYSGCNFHFLSGAMCGGYSAGLEAARAALEVKDLADIDVADVTDAKKRTFRPLNVQEGLSPREFENAVREVMVYYMGLVRNQKGLEVALEKLNLIESRSEEIKATNYHELMRASEAVHLLKHCQLSVMAAMERKESGRTIYKRIDYPELNPTMDRCLVLWQENGEPKIAFGPPL